MSMIGMHAGAIGRWACEGALERGGGRAARIPATKESHRRRTAIYRHTANRHQKSAKVFGVFFTF